MSLKQSCLVCLSAVLTINAPLTEVIETMQETRIFPLQTVGTASERSAELSVPSGECSRPSVGTTKPSECPFPWLVCECFSILQSPSTASDKESISEDAVSTLRSEVLLFLIVFVRNYFTLLR